MFRSKTRSNKKWKHLFLALTALTSAATVATFISCSQQSSTIWKQAAVYEKKTEEGDKPYVQLNTYGFKDYTFSDFKWAITDERSLVYLGVPIVKANGSVITGQGAQTSEDAKAFNDELLFQYFAIKAKWDYKKLSKHEWLKRDFYVVDKAMQERFEDYQKSISLIKSDDELKKALRLTDEEQLKYQNYYKAITPESELENVKDEVAYFKERYMPWSNTFNFDVIKSKLDFKKYNYLFIKDFHKTILNHGEAVSRLDGGIDLKDYEIDVTNKKLTLKTGGKPETNDGESFAVTLAVEIDKSGRLNSFMIPIEKTKLTEFDFNEWEIIFNPKN
ncbi:hypothetical protein [Mycoplasmopsis agassizii]|uniref:Lipoprotein n=1 Tax=Mycoplasmopsis agassizii TaxID=33922 RepID=A0ABX4H5S4_9BACT|nr:hypothetical protein [Mycoplasmopsis agassizii]PAF55220.1 hypothetical protein CJF60_00845 [Mycoplasmopsis agassizii]SMC18776.1 hypothetical protein SAMN02745179_00763 [Mycoplasmopsis agassizii]